MIRHEVIGEWLAQIMVLEAPRLQNLIMIPCCRQKWRTDVARCIAVNSSRRETTPDLDDCESKGARTEVFHEAQNRKKVPGNTWEKLGPGTENDLDGS